MYSPSQFRRSYTKKAHAYIRNRQELYDKSGQLFCLTLSPSTGDKVPFMVKLPRLSSNFRQMPEGNYISYSNEGLFNGLYFVSSCYMTKKLDIQCPGGFANQVSGKHLLDKILNHKEYKLYRNARKRVEVNLRVNPEGVITQAHEEDRIDFNKDATLCRDITNAFPNLRRHKFREVVSQMAEMQNTLCEALARGNTNNIRRKAWSHLIDDVSKVVSDVINDPDNHNNNVDKDSKDLAAYKRDLPRLIRQNRTSGLLDKDIADLKREIARLEERVGRTFNNMFKKPVVPDYINIETLNNGWDMCYGYMTTCVRRDQLELWYTRASSKANGRQSDAESNVRKHAKECARTLSECLEERCYHTCNSHPPNHCALPNAKKTPDVVVGVIPDDPKDKIKFPIFIFEVIGKKSVHITGKNEIHFPGFLECMQSLVFAPYAYYGEVDADKVTLFKLQKHPKDGRIGITKYDYTYAVDGEIGSTLAEIMDMIAEILLDVLVNLSFIQMESSRLLKMANYSNFVADLDGQKKLTEMHCWHLFETTYVGQHIYEPSDCTVHDFQDQFAFPIEHARVVPDRIVANEAKPVIKKHYSQREERDLNKKFTKAVIAGAGDVALFKKPTSRALRSYKTGAPLDPYVAQNWNEAYNNFIENRQFSTINRTCGPVTRHVTPEMDVHQKTRVLQENEKKMHKLYNPVVLQPPETLRKPITGDATPDLTADDNFVITIDEEVEENADDVNLSNLGLTPNTQYLSGVADEQIQRVYGREDVGGGSFIEQTPRTGWTFIDPAAPTTSPRRRDPPLPSSSRPKGFIRSYAEAFGNLVTSPFKSRLSYSGNTPAATPRR